MNPDNFFWCARPESIRHRLNTQKTQDHSVPVIWVLKFQYLYSDELRFTHWKYALAEPLYLHLTYSKTQQHFIYYHLSYRLTGPTINLSIKNLC